jgi:hypothetical protein
MDLALPAIHWNASIGASTVVVMLPAVGATADVYA